MGVVWDRIRVCTSTLHIRASAWRLLFLLEALTLFAVLFFGLYCEGDRCPAKGYWPEDVWGESGCLESIWCEKCDLKNFLRTPVDALSNVSFVMVGWIILVFGLEDIYYFHYSRSDVVCHPLQDYARTSPPSLMLSSSGNFHVLLILPSSVALIYTGVSSFLYHASYSVWGSLLDIASVWSIASFVIPFVALNHLNFFASALHPYWGKRVLVVFISGGMIAALVVPHYLPDKYRWGVDQHLIVPCLAGTVFILEMTYYAVLFRRVRLRARADVIHFVLAAAIMGISLHLQLHDLSSYCFQNRQSRFQAHAVWHCGMAIGIMLVYFFLRQERPRGPAEMETGEPLVERGSEKSDDDAGHELVITVKETRV